MMYHMVHIFLDGGYLARVRDSLIFKNLKLVKLFSSAEYLK